MYSAGCPVGGLLTIKSGRCGCFRYSSYHVGTTFSKKIGKTEKNLGDVKKSFIVLLIRIQRVKMLSANQHGTRILYHNDIKSLEQLRDFESCI